MSLRRNLFANWHARIIAAVAMAVAGLGFWLLPFTQSLTYFSYDLPFAWRLDVRPTEAVIVYMDDESRIQLTQPVQGPWDRALHVRLLKELSARQAKAVVFDVLFDEPWPDPAVDKEFAAAIGAHGPVVLAAQSSETGENGEPIVSRIRQAVEPLRNAAMSGVAELELDADEVLRRHYSNPLYPNLAWQAAAAAGYPLPNRNRLRWINYYGPAGTIPHVSYHQMFEPDAVSSAAISNKVVFVGKAPMITYEGSRNSDEFRTSYTRWSGSLSPGVEVHATACLNLIRGDWLSRLPFGIEFSAIVATALALGLGLPLFRPIVSVGLGVGFALALGAVSVVVAQQQHWWFSWAVISFVEVPVALGWTLLNAVSQRSPAVLSDEDGGQPQVPDHEMVRPVGEGSYGQVWLVKNALGTYRAAKLVFKQNFENERPFDREFLGIEAFEPVSRSHEGLVHILQVGRREKAGYFYCVMELADDQILGQEIRPEDYVPRTLASEVSRRGKIPAEECAQIGTVLAGALHHLHEVGLVHRDIKPSNIIFVRGVPKLADVGLVTAAKPDASFVGTEGFIAPEGPGSPQADIYSLGKVLYEIAMGRDRCNFPELPTTLADDPDREQLMALNEIILKACRPNPVRRYSSADKMQADLKRLANRFRAAKRNAP